MTAEIVQFPTPAERTGNGAREALMEIEDWLYPRPEGISWADWVLMQLWERQFKVVPLELGDFE